MKKISSLLLVLVMLVSTATFAQDNTSKNRRAVKNEKTTEPKAVQSDAPLKKDGTPDKRYKENKKLKKDGTPDKRYKENKAVN